MDEIYEIIFEEMVKDALYEACNEGIITIEEREKLLKAAFDQTDDSTMKD